MHNSGTFCPEGGLAAALRRTNKKEAECGVRSYPCDYMGPTRITHDTLAPPECPLYHLQRTLHFWYFGHHMCGGFPPHQAIPCNTYWVSHNSTQYWHYLPRDRVISHRSRAQIHKNAPFIPCPLPPPPNTLQKPVTSPGYHVCFSPSSCRWEVPRNQSLGLTNLLEPIYRTQGNTCLNLQLIKIW